MHKLWTAFLEYRQYLHQSRGLPLQDIWSYQPYTNGCLYGENEEIQKQCIDQDVKWVEKRGGDERLPYPTQKPEGLLERIITSSSKEGDIVLDPFCGCGTAVAVAQRLKRRWIGIDITHLAVNLIKQRLRDHFTVAVDKEYDVIGEPASVKDAAQLAKEDPFQFESWALGLVGARQADSAKKGADKGIDGRLYFHDDKSGKSKQIIISVKAGENVSVAMVRDLNGVLAREKAQIGVLISMEPPTKPMLKEAAESGFYTAPPPVSGKFPAIQILTIEQLLEGKQISYPGLHVVTYKKAKLAKGKKAESMMLPLEEVDDVEEDDEGEE